MNFIEYADRDMLAIDLANTLAGELETALLHHETVSFAVPGGSTPGPVFDALCAANVDWERVHVFATDERWVPEDNTRSNARLIRERLLVNRAAAAAGKPLISGAISQWEGQLSVFDPANGAPCYQCIFPEAPAPELAVKQ